MLVYDVPFGHLCLFCVLFANFQFLSRSLERIQNYNHRRYFDIRLRHNTVRHPISKPQVRPIPTSCQRSLSDFLLGCAKHLVYTFRTELLLLYFYDMILFM